MAPSGRGRRARSTTFSQSPAWRTGDTAHRNPARRRRVRSRWRSQGWSLAQEVTRRRRESGALQALVGAGRARRAAGGDLRCGVGYPTDARLAKRGKPKSPIRGRSDRSIAQPGTAILGVGGRGPYRIFRQGFEELHRARPSNALGHPLRFGSEMASEQLTI
jgi:hypothetical protein